MIRTEFEINSSVLIVSSVRVDRAALLLIRLSLKVAVHRGTVSEDRTTDPSVLDRDRDRRGWRRDRELPPRAPPDPHHEELWQIADVQIHLHLQRLTALHRQVQRGLGFVVGPEDLGDLD